MNNFSFLPVVRKAVLNKIAFLLLVFQSPVKAIRTVILFSCCFLNACHVEILPAWRSDDGYTAMSRADQNLFGDGAADNRQSGFTELDARDLKTMIADHHGITWLAVFSSWCPHALKDQERLITLRSELMSMNVLTVCLYTDFHPDFLNKKFQLTANGFPVYFMMHQPGVGQEQKMKSFFAALDYGLPDSGGVPQHFLLDSEGKIIYAQRGEINDPVSLLRGLASDGDLPISRR
jgi:hypothetical protein